MTMTTVITPDALDSAEAPSRAAKDEINRNEGAAAGRPPPPQLG
jgi:hypothetical protein